MKVFSVFFERILDLCGGQWWLRSHKAKSHSFENEHLFSMFLGPTGTIQHKQKELVGGFIDVFSTRACF